MKRALSQRSAVMPAQAGTQSLGVARTSNRWIPTFVGMTALERRAVAVGVMTTLECRSVGPEDE